MSAAVLRLHLRPLEVGRGVVWLDREAPYRRWRYRVRAVDGHFSGREATRDMALAMVETLVRRERIQGRARATANGSGVVIPA